MVGFRRGAESQPHETQWDVRSHPCEMQWDARSQPRETQRDVRSQVGGQCLEENEAKVGLDEMQQVVAGCLKGMELRPRERWGERCVGARKVGDQYSANKETVAERRKTVSGYRRGAEPRPHEKQ